MKLNIHNRKGYLLTNGRIVYPTKEQWDIICYEYKLKIKG